MKFTLEIDSLIAILINEVNPVSVCLILKSGSDFTYNSYTQTSPSSFGFLVEIVRLSSLYRCMCMHYFCLSVCSLIIYNCLSSIFLMHVAVFLSDTVA